MMATQEVSSVTFKETHGITTPKVENLNPGRLEDLRNIGRK